MQVTLQNGELVEVFSKQLLDLDNGKVPVDAYIGLIVFSANCCKFTT